MANIISNEIRFKGSSECINRLKDAFSSMIFNNNVILDNLTKANMSTILYHLFMECDANELRIECDTRWSPISELSTICEQYNVECNYRYFGEDSGRMTYKNGKEKWY